MQVRFLQQFLKTESAGGLFLLISASLAIILANSPMATHYTGFASAQLFLVNDILMAIFFLLVGLELKREWLTGSLNRHSVRLPIASAFGGMIIPAILYLLINIHSPSTRVGWSIPVATDIAFALSTLSLFGKRVPTSLKIFLMSLAIFDDVGAILIIAFFYTHDLSISYLLLTLLPISALFVCRRLSLTYLSIYLMLGALLWYTFLKAGIHPTIAGVILALFIPGDSTTQKAPLVILEKALHPWVVFGIMPLFAFCNAGFPISINELQEASTSLIVIGTIVGLFLGKQLGVFGFAMLLIYTGYAKLPKDINTLSLYGVSLLCGIGFTMSLFLGTLSFPGLQTVYLAEVRIGVITGSLLSGISGAIVLWFTLLNRNTRKLT